MAIAIALGMSVVDSGAKLIAHWSFDESSGHIAHDSVSHYDGILSQTGSSFVAGGVSGRALKLNFSQNGFVKCPNVLPFTSGDFSIVAWVKLENGIPYDNSMIVSKHEAYTRNGYYLASWSTEGKALLAAGDYVGSNASYSQSDVLDNNWHFVVGVYRDGVQKEIYVDDNVVEETTPTQSIEPNSASLMIGGCFVYGQPTGKFTGMIDDVRIYNHALSSEEIRELATPPVPPVANRSIIWQHQNGALAKWNMSYTQYLGSESIKLANPLLRNSRVIVVDDFAGDSADDLLFRRMDGALLILHSGGLSPMTSLVPSTWRLVGSGDFNNDGNSDLAWMDGAMLKIWCLSNGALMQERVMSAPYIAKSTAVGDLNQDGYADIVWQLRNGNVAVAYMRDGVLLSSTLVDGRANAAWRLAGVDVFNADGYQDLLWQRSDGKLAVWFMNGANRIAVETLRPGERTAPRWDVVGTE